MTPLQAITLSNIAYLTPLEAAPRVAALGFKYIDLVTVDDAQALIVRSDSENIVAHRGTPVTQNTDIGMIWDDLNRAHTDLDNGHILVRGGFWHPLCDLFPIITRALDPTLPIKGIGHSLGGVRALLMAALVPPWISYTAMTFAPPTGANKAFFDMAYKGRIAPTVYGRKHDFALNWDVSDSETAQPGPIVHLLSPGVETIPSWNDLWESVSDHSVDLYQSDIAALTN